MPLPELRWWNRLSVRITAVITIATAIGGAVFLGLVLRAQREQLTEQTMSNAAFLSDTLVNSLQRHMLRNERSELLGSLQAVAAQPLMAELRLFDSRGLTQYSMNPSEIGRTASKREPACIACHSNGHVPDPLTISARSRIIAQGNGRVLVTVSPIYNRPTCSSAACHAHPPSQRVLGLLEVGTSLAHVDGTLASLQRTTAVVALLTVLGLAVTAIVFTRRRVTGPVEQLADGVRRVAQGDLKEPVPVVGSGEIAALAQSFNEMEGALLEMRRQRLALLESLEQQVQERTAALEKARERLMQGEKLSSLGRLAASIAHEINNPLAGILTYAKLLVRTLEEAPPDEAARAKIIGQLKLVERETQRCTAIVRNLLDFARERPLKLAQIDVNAAIGEALFLINNQVKMQNITLEHELGGLPAIEADFGQIRQALVNILINACDAMPSGGTLRIVSRQAGDAVEIEVRDTGPGIAPEHLKKVLDPFFSTKEKGTGLGLSVVYGIVERHGGALRIDSTPGKGTDVTITLPTACAAVAVGPPAEPGRPAPQVA
ncbi:MAG TPA: ATP-binding protein [Vicinamibacterales bacterium]|nr:ATP-binding protein [Vicinamibacterales bacterium]